MSVTGPNSLTGVLQNPTLLSALYPNLNLTGLANLYTNEQNALNAPLQQSTTELQKITSQSAAWQTIQAKVQAVQSDFNSLSQSQTWKSAQASSSNTAVATAAASSAATAGSYLVDVTQMGQQEIAVGSSSYASSSSSLNLVNQTVQLNGASISITSADSLTSIAQKINQANAGVTASVINANGSYQLSLTSTNYSAITGSGSDLFGTGAQGLAVNLGAPVQAAQGWQYTVNGIPVTSTSTTDSQTIPGVTLTLLSTGVTDVNLQTSGSSAQSSLSQLAQDYNSLESTVTQYTAKGAPLAGDTTAEGLMNQVNSQLFTTNGSLPFGFQSVTDAGLTLTLNADKSTSLTFTSTTFQTAYQANPSAIQTLFAGSSASPGLAGGLSTMLNSFAASGSGVISSILQGYQSQIQALQNSQQAQENLIQLQQQALSSQFNRELDALIAVMGQQSTVTGLLNQLTGSSSSSSGTKG